MNNQPAYFARHAKITIAVCLVSLNVMVSTSGMLAAVEAGGQDLPDSIRVKLHGVHSMGFVRNSGLYPSSICYVLSFPFAVGGVDQPTEISSVCKNRWKIEWGGLWVWGLP